MKKALLCVVPIFCSLIQTSCSSTLAAFNGRDKQLEIAFNDMRLELSDIKHEINGYQVELQIVEDKLKNVQQNTINSKGTSNLTTRLEMLAQQISLFEKKLQGIENLQEKVALDMQSLKDHANQTSEYLSQYKRKIESLEGDVAIHQSRFKELGNLKSTLNSISSAMEKQNKENCATYKVKPGDTLSHIAAEHHVSLEALRNSNGKSGDQIFVGEVLNIPHE